MTVRFFLPPDTDFARLQRLDPDRDVTQFLRGEDVWVLQTYLRLAQAGYDVQLSSELPADGLLVFHAKHRRLVAKRWSSNCRAVLVAVRADKDRTPIADFEILQNDRFAKANEAFFVPSWPQPGILPRRAERGSQITRIAFKGFRDNLAPAFLQPSFGRELAYRGIDFQLDGVEYSREAVQFDARQWSDYQDVDVILAVRPALDSMHEDKPATKLYNAWFAGVVPLLGPEYAFRSLRRSELDYVEVKTPADALAAIDRLRNTPDLYARMIDNGFERAEAFTTARILEQWADLLFETLPELARQRRVRMWESVPLTVKWLGKGALSFVGI
jgi:hypothetical protein